jgi:ATP-dependent helicase/nuclease subunit A
MPRHEAAERQVIAADPGFSTWLSANAGSGKTTVLTDRVARLLLRGVSPAHILCLTYTKAAATEMQNRLFLRLGQWAMLPDAKLHQSLSDLGLRGPQSAQTLSEARRLFARAIETPGGLRIQTIHSFCAGLLRRFPLEAGVSPQFKEVDDRSVRLLRAEIVEEMADGLDPQAVTDLGMIHSGAEFDKLLAEISAIGSAKGLTPDNALALYDLPKGESLEALLADTFLGSEADLLTTLGAAMETGTPTDIGNVALLARIAKKLPKVSALEALEKLVLYGPKAKSPFGAKIDAFPGKDVRKGRLSNHMPDLNALMARVESARARRLVINATQKTATLYRFAAAFLPLYSARKAARGWLDFDDLIAFTTRLLSNPGVAAWVLYRLDGGIEHILVDEAQDTSPAQWRVIEALAAEFTSGASAHEGERTLFVVGDKKQSIYSFQGADVAIFDDKRDKFERDFAAVSKPFNTTSLDYSFRSSPAILDLVDAVFQPPEFARAMGDAVFHLAFRADLPGRVELWPDIPPQKIAADADWEQPVDLITPEHHAAVLADKLAVHMRQMLDSGAQIATRDGPRRVHAGDFLILVQRRSALFGELIRACKTQNLPIAGADRLKLAAEMAVKDLSSLLAFIATPEDDLALAEVLRSALVGLSEADLFTLAYGRRGYLWEALRAKADLFPTAFALLTDLRDQADYLRPYDLLERILITHKGRQRLLTRLGEEAADGIDAFVQQALDYESADVPSLTGFLVWLQDDTLEIKRQTEAAGGRIRIMTVHGAKGLEAEIVILPDCADPHSRDRDTVMRAEEALPMWSMPSGQRPAAMEARAEARKERTRDENLRLLYVALTRARSMLIIAAAGETKTETTAGPKAVTDLSWYRLLERALKTLNPDDAGDGRLVYSYGASPAPAGPVAEPPLEATSALPDWARTPHKAPDHAAALLAPSDLGGAKVLPGEAGEGDDDGEAALQRGTAIHLLLEHLPTAPVAYWPNLAAGLIPDPTLRASAYDEAARVLQSPALAALFAQGSLGEVAVTGDLAGRRLYGTIDRLIVSPTQITLVDFKSNRLVPATAADIPEGLLRQLGAYAHLLAAIYPQHIIQPAILWTATARLMPLDNDMVRAALARSTIP